MLKKNCIVCGKEFIKKTNCFEDAKNCGLLWDINNGETLCIACHRQTDSYKVNQWK